MTTFTTQLADILDTATGHTTVQTIPPQATDPAAQQAPHFYRVDVTSFPDEDANEDISLSIVSTEPGINTELTLWFPQQEVVVDHKGQYTAIDDEGTTYWLKSVMERGVSAEDIDPNLAPPWDNNAAQFPRLLCEIAATQDNLDMQALAAAMDLNVDQVKELFDRADEVWERAKAVSI